MPLDPRLQAFERLLNIMDELREKCPWDQKQTLQSLRHLTIEEIYELSDALISDDSEEIRKELGDLFLHLVFYAKIGTEEKRFDLEGILNGICEKLIHRHPHIYGNSQADTEEEVLKNWQQLKLKEGNSSILSGVPKSLPSLDKAERIQSKVIDVGFVFETPQDALDKLTEELAEFLAAKTQEEKEEEFGDILFALVSFAKKEKINPSAALEKTNKKFIRRFQQLEILVKKDQLVLGDIKKETLLAYYKQTKS